MTIAFIRTYNNKQNSEVQEAVIREFAESQKIEIGKWAKRWEIVLVRTADWKVLSNL